MVANRLKNLRLAHKIKQSELANILSVSQSTISGWESERYEIDNANLCKLADYFHVSIDYLLCHTNNQNVSQSVPFDLNSILDEDIVVFKNVIINPNDKQLIKQILTRFIGNGDSN